MQEPGTDHVGVSQPEQHTHQQQEVHAISSRSTYVVVVVVFTVRYLPSTYPTYHVVQ